MSSHRRFYQELQAFRDFSGIGEARNFRSVPADWHVVITDVRGSTQAIQEGRYKDVNTIGAAAVACVQNVLGGEEFPFVFGGDGATILLPAEAIEPARKALCDLRGLARAQFGLGLRVGIVPVADLLASGSKLEVARFDLGLGKSIAIFRGGGLNDAEKRVKGNPEQYEARADEGSNPELTGLSCRWQPIPNRRGTVLSLLVISERAGRVSGAQDDHYLAVLKEIERILGGSLESANPVAIEQMKYKSFWQLLKDEWRYHQRHLLDKAFRLRLFQSLVCLLMFPKRRASFVPDPEPYKKSMAAHSDYRKFDDMLRMVIDCSVEQAAQIEAYLERERARGNVRYGVHRSDTALMTCFLQGLEDGKHIHFIDGGDGGYAMAAKILKQQAPVVTVPDRAAA